MPLRLVKLRRSANWYVRGTVSGQRVFESTRTDQRDLALVYRNTREREIWERRVVGGTTFAAAVSAYLDAGGEARYLTPLVLEIGRTHIGAIGQKTIDDLAKKLYPAASNDTRRRHVYTPMAAVLHHAADRGECAWLRVKLPKAKPGRVRFLEPDEAGRLIANCNDNLRPLATFLLYTGCRLGNAIDLDWSRVDLKARTAFIPRTKNGQPRSLHLPESAVIALANLPGNREGRVFAYASRFGLRSAWRTACKRAGLDDLHPHDLRHTYATWMRRYAKLDLKGLMAAGGWQSIQSVLRYEHVVPAETARAARRLPKVGGQ